MIKVAIVEDDNDIRKLTASLLNMNEDIECIGLYASAEDFLTILPTSQADVVLMDIGLPEKNGIDCVRESHDLFPNIEFIMFTDHVDPKKVFDALSVGATGYVVKGEKPERLANAIRDVVAGGSPMSRQISRLVTASFQRTEPQFPELEKLTEQERIVLNCLDEGLSYKEIAAKRYVSENTVRTQVRSVYEKLQVHTRTDALNKLHKRK